MLLEVPEGVILNGVDEGLRHGVDGKLGEDLNEDKTENEVNGELLSLGQVVLIPLADRVRGRVGCRLSVMNEQWWGTEPN